MMLYMMRELIKRTYNYFAYTSFCYGRELLSSKFFVKLETTTRKKLNRWCWLPEHKNKKAKGNENLRRKGKRKKKEL